MVLLYKILSEKIQVTMSKFYIRTLFLARQSIDKGKIFMNSEEITIDLRQLAHILKKKFKIIVAVTLATTLIGLAYIFIKEPVYASNSLLHIQLTKGLMDSPLREEITEANAHKKVNTYVAILKSRSVVEPVIEKLETPDENGALPSYDDYVENKIITENLRDTEILKITTQAESPEKAQELNKLLVESFLNLLTKLSQSNQSSMREFLEERVKESQNELTLAEDKLNEFKREKNFFSPNEQMEIISRRLEFIDKEKADNQIKLETAKARYDTTSSQFDTNKAGLANNSSIRNYQIQLAELEAVRIDYLEKYTEEHPLVKEINENIVGIKKFLDAEIEKVAKQQAPSEDNVYQSLLIDKFRSEAEIAVAENNLAIIAEIERNHEGEIAKLSDTERVYLELTRDLNLAQEIYIMLAKRLEEAKVAEISVSNEVSVVDNPSLSTKAVEPKKARILEIATIVGLLFSSGFFILREIMDDKIKSGEELRRKTKLPMLAQIPCKAANMEAYRTIGGFLIRQEAKSILVTSTLSGEGKSSTIANVGICLAKANKKILLVDCNSQSPVLSKLLTTLPDNLSLKSSSEFIGESSEFLLTDKLEKLLDKWKAEFDLILIDSPSIQTNADATILASKVDGTVLIVENRKASSEAIIDSKISLEQSGTKILGVILTKYEV